jgi:molybdate transport system regulatory protein
VWLERRGAFALGDGGIRFLLAIEESGSVRAGAERVRWSYRHALAYLDNAERRLGRQLVTRTRGGHTRGGATLTADGHDLVRRFGQLERNLETALQRLYTSAFAGWPCA